MSTIKLLGVMTAVDVLSIYNLLDWSGDNWPQPKPKLAWDYEWDWDAIAELEAQCAADHFGEHD